MGLLDRISFQKTTHVAPDSLELTPDGGLRIVWPGGATATVTPFLLRDRCPCASCIEEGTGKKLLDPSTIPADIRIDQVAPVGNYAVQIFWSDGHSTGLYSWETLRRASGV